MDDVEDLAISGRAKEPGFRAVLEVRGQLFQKGGCRAPYLLDVLELIGAGPRAAGIADLLLPRDNLEHAPRKVASRAPQIDLKGQGIAAWLALDDPLQRRVGHQPAVPVMFALDLDRWKAGGKGGGGHHVLRFDRVRRGVEVDEISRPDIDRSHAEAEQARVEAVEIDQALQCTLEFAG